MTELKNISEEETEKEEIKGEGLSVSQFFCQKGSSADSATYAFFENFAVPFGLFYTPCESSTSEDSNDEPSVCEKFDQIFDMAARNLGKGNRTTRKKINK